MIALPAPFTALTHSHDLHLLQPGQDDVAAWSIDQRKRWHGQPLAVLLPGDTAALAAAVALCAQHGLRMVVQGGNTGLVGGGVPDGSGQEVVISLRRMNRIRAVDPLNLCLIAEAGCTLAQVQEAAQAHGLLFPLSLASEGSCTIGGNLASNAGGTQVLRYGNARDLCLGLEAVSASGQVLHGLKTLRKDNSGYDLRQLLLGSEGTLAIISAASLKLFARPQRLHTALALCSDLDQACDLLMAARSRLGPLLTAFEVMNATARALVRRHFPAIRQPLDGPWAVLLEWEQHGMDDATGQAQNEALWQALLAGGQAQDVALAQSQAQAQQMWALRESISAAQGREGLNVKHDIALPISAIPAFCQGTDAALLARWPGVRGVNFGHLGDGNLHYNVQAPEGEDPAAFLATHEAAINRVVFDAVQAAGGTFSAEHGIGWLKKDELAQRGQPLQLDWMRRIKAALDPHNLLGRGRLLDV
ncbi:FAD-binding oxidoreductase [Amphibiibacter pelophylacis]|uniref:FAD-binding oxidoreductase n=1 Tax=Amphibiibacter pelophylacis TaxID=1799477 RepID=A0ACC6P6B2_9BURK